MKIFGGGRVLPKLSDIGERNVDFVREFLKQEGLKIVSEDVGDTCSRHVQYFPRSGRVRVRHLSARSAGARLRTSSATSTGSNRRRSPARSTCSEGARHDHQSPRRRRLRAGAQAAERDPQARAATSRCVGAAADPFAARELIKQLNPDVITLDVEMPRMDGITFLENLMRLRPMPVVMVSSLTERGADVTLRALELGAVDFVAKPKIDVAGDAGGLRATSSSRRSESRRARACCARPSAARRARSRRASQRRRRAAGAAAARDAAHDRSHHRHRRLHRRHRGDPRSARRAAAGRAGDRHLAAHARGLQQAVRRAPEPLLARWPCAKRSDGQHDSAGPRLHRAGRPAPAGRARRRPLRLPPERRPARQPAPAERRRAVPLGGRSTSGRTPSA